MQQGMAVLTKYSTSSQNAYPGPEKFPLHSINIAANPDFVGRRSQLKSLYRLLVEDHNEARPVACVLYGNPGVGKTQTALKFVYDYMTEFNAVFWVSADADQDMETLRTFGNIGRRLGLIKNEDLHESQVEVVLNWLQTAGIVLPLP